MSMMTLAEAAALLPDAVMVGDGATPIARVHSDTRTLQPGDLFVALRGERFDAHDFLPQARQAGAAAALAEHGLAEAGLPGLLVRDVQRALEFLAAAWRRRFDLPLIAVTGSNGKTTVTQMVAAILRAWLAEGALSTEGNYNNHIGVPLTVLRLRQDEGRWHRAAVVELGMNHPGEIALLSRIAAPTVALVNNAQREHQEFMATVEAVARENGSVIEALGPTGVAVYPADDAHAPVWHELAGTRPQITFARQGAADVTGEALWIDGLGARQRDAGPPQGPLQPPRGADAVPGGRGSPHWALTLHTPAGPASLALHAPGEHNVKNALAATACALAAGVPLAAIVQGLQGFEPVKGRSQLKAATLHGRAVTLVDDTYNANPDSMRAAIDVLAALPAPRALLMGDMGEVGDNGPAFHAEIGAYAQSRGIELLWAAGAASADAVRAHAQARHFESTQALVDALGELPAVSSIVVKGSRFMRMERVVAALQAGGAHAA